MTNLELINAFHNLEEFQRREKRELENTGKRILGNHIKITYAINKNKRGIVDALGAYNETREALNRDYRDLDAERKAYEAEQSAAQKEKRNPNPVKMIFRKGKTAEEYSKKVEELCNLETDFQPKTIQVTELEGLEITSEELELLMFMID